ncbi:hypothetical protein ACLI4U_08710 [Natrialbaceae archaeon A-CW2]|uniref:hypothetical protein n=1 Tax=Natronosalvus amylolyticus TaxID=2961994 RepID=UPI0020C9BC30|nr:hypothetical protein [Natronosalvus amylolyticus]
MSRLVPLYLGGIVLNGGALAFAVLEGEYLFAGAFLFVLIYLSVRLRMVRAESA